MTKNKQRLLFICCSIISATIIGYFIYRSFESTTSFNTFNIVHSEKRDNGVYLKTKDPIKQSGKEIFIDKEGNIYSNDYIE